MPSKVNTTQSEITEELLSKLSGEYKSEFYELLEAIPLVKSLIDPKRKYARNLERDDKGRIKVSIEEPHILEDVDFFRERAIYFQQNGRYTDLFPNATKGSSYYKFWEEEIDKCINGCVRPSDGEWITGYHYFYLNYSRIDLVKEDEYGKEIKVEDFPKFWDGDYWWYHYLDKCEVQGGHAICLKTRRRGYSFKNSSQACRNFHCIRKSKSYFIADTKGYLESVDGIVTKAWQTTDFINQNSELKKLSDKKSTTMERVASRINDEGIQVGYMSTMSGIITGDDPDKIRGLSGKLMMFEEAGKNKNLMYSWTIARPSFEQGRRVFGTMIAFGTGGTEGSNFSGMWEMFTNPIPYNIAPIKNIYSKNSVNSVCSYFHPEYINREFCYDADGNSDVVKALVTTLEDRMKVRHASDINIIIAKRAEQPITPEEAVMKKEGSFFPVTDIREYLSTIIADEKLFCSKHHTVELVVDSGGNISPLPSFKQVIREYPIPRDSSKGGCIEIYEMPDTSMKFNYWRYISGIDPIDDDYALYSDSLGSIFIFDRWKRRIVAEYTGRPQSANEFYEICHRMLRFYNALANYENNKKGLFAYFSQKNLLRFLCDTPRILQDKDMVKEKYGYGNKAKGYNANAQINDWGRRLQLDWMMQNAYEDDGENRGRSNLRTIRSLGYLKELLQWNPDMNADRVSSMGACMILDADMAKFELVKTEGDNDDDRTKSLKEFSSNFFKH